MRQDVSTDLTKTRNGMLIWGYRPVTETDLIPNQELVMVEVERFAMSSVGLSPRSAPGCTDIRLDEEPIKLSNRGNGSKMVYYHCIMPPWDQQCFVPLKSFIQDAYVPNESYANDTRCFVKK